MGSDGTGTTEMREATYCEDRRNPFTEPLAAANGGSTEQRGTRLFPVQRLRKRVGHLIVLGTILYVCICVCT